MVVAAGRQILGGCKCFYLRFRPVIYIIQFLSFFDQFGETNSFYPGNLRCIKNRFLFFAVPEKFQAVSHFPVGVSQELYLLVLSNKIPCYNYPGKWNSFRVCQNVSKSIIQ